MSNQTTRRGFLKLLGGAAGALGLGAALPCPTPEPEPTPAPLGVSEQGEIIMNAPMFSASGPYFISGVLTTAGPGVAYWGKDGQYLKLND